MSDNKFNVPDETLGKIYDDVFRSSAQETGKSLSLIPRAINVALSSLDIYLFKRECNISAVKALIAEKAQNTPPENIVCPEPYVAVPALQAISYCMDSKTLRNLYANLLANAINNKVKDTVHPAFVNIIGQLAPLDVLLINSLFDSSNKTVPVAKLHIEKRPNLHLAEQQYECITFNEFILDTPLEKTYKLTPSIDNLSRLGLVRVGMDFLLNPSSCYDYVENSTFYNSTEVQNALSEPMPGGRMVPCITKGYVSLTEFGVNFFNACVMDPS